jgi:hypothetical protein
MSIPSKSLPLGRALLGVIVVAIVVAGAAGWNGERMARLRGERESHRIVESADSGHPEFASFAVTRWEQSVVTAEDLSPLLAVSKDLIETDVASETARISGSVGPPPGTFRVFGGFNVISATADQILAPDAVYRRAGTPDAVWTVTPLNPYPLMVNDPAFVLTKDDVIGFELRSFSPTTSVSTIEQLHVSMWSPAGTDASTAPVQPPTPDSSEEILEPVSESQPTTTAPVADTDASGQVDLFAYSVTGREFERLFPLIQEMVGLFDIEPQVQVAVTLGVGADDVVRYVEVTLPQPAAKAAGDSETFQVKLLITALSADPVAIPLPVDAVPSAS